MVVVIIGNDLFKESDIVYIHVPSKNLHKIITFELFPSFMIRQ